LSPVLGIACFSPRSFLDCVHEPGAQLFLLAVHRQNRHVLSEPDDQMSTFAGFEGAALFLQPAFELGARHPNQRYNE
jgi:hypothetical protein